MELDGNVFARLWVRAKTRAFVCRANVFFQYSIDQWQRRRLHARFNIFSDERKYGTRAQHIYHMDEDINVFAAPGPVQFKWASQEMSPPDVRNIDVIPLFFFNAIIAWQVAAAYDTHPHT